MTEKHSWYKAEQRRKQITKEKKLKAARYLDEMNKRAEQYDATHPK